MEKLTFQINDFITHKQHIFESGKIIINYLYSIGEDIKAMELLRKIMVHDNSKIYECEILALAKIQKGIRCFTNPQSLLSLEEKDAISLHWKNNKHHPEHFDNYNKMNEIDIMEMVCDWHARSTQYQTNFMEFVYTRQKNRFHFSKKMFKIILFYCKILEQ